MAMLDLYRFNQSDLEDVKLADVSKYATIDEGEWLHPLGNQADQWDVFAGAAPSADVTSNLAAMIFMEKGRTDARAVGKMTVVRGVHVRGRTDVFITAEAASMLPGVALTLKKDTDGRVKLGVAAVGDVVKAHVYKAPANDPLGLLHFSLAA
jgi:hypothetical protein